MLVVLLITETFVNTYKLFLHFIDDSHVINKLATIRDGRKKQLKVANRANFDITLLFVLWKCYFQIDCYKMLLRALQ